MLVCLVGIEEVPCGV